MSKLFWLIISVTWLNVNIMWLFNDIRLHSIPMIVSDIVVIIVFTWICFSLYNKIDENGIPSKRVRDNKEKTAIGF
jgi:biotin transporter BioY